uniref:Uncharacterized protein n=1 Tax=Chromera velia CCMP2878 TaxID=1169474 RepID=A0A0G4HWT9_9ALVE|eukprot:Cvel_1472.t1-p1 / transcript=Cvel_1472.t1 / gene=Cvel_1472 / organism=Chromera_velia_CCMP2878 / gene_product=hypothetical protein / transcript_product=hypothetical protein / location=Cvel_scaffold51:144737-155835(+) / protein_length=1863 / sequence_SO=supercontig / SO=protein_coding / is_pseudo=false
MHPQQQSQHQQGFRDRHAASPTASWTFTPFINATRSQDYFNALKTHYKRSMGPGLVTPAKRNISAPRPPPGAPAMQKPSLLPQRYSYTSTFSEGFDLSSTIGRSKGMEFQSGSLSLPKVASVGSLLASAGEESRDQGAVAATRRTRAGGRGWNDQLTAAVVPPRARFVGPLQNARALQKEMKAKSSAGPRHVTIANPDGTIQPSHTPESPKNIRPTRDSIQSHARTSLASTEGRFSLSLTPPLNGFEASSTLKDTLHPGYRPSAANASTELQGGDSRLASGAACALTPPLLGPEPLHSNDLATAFSGISFAAATAPSGGFFRPSLDSPGIPSRGPERPGPSQLDDHAGPPLHEGTSRDTNRGKGPLRNAPPPQAIRGSPERRASLVSPLGAGVTSPAVSSPRATLSGDEDEDAPCERPSDLLAAALHSSISPFVARSSRGMRDKGGAGKGSGDGSMRESPLKFSRDEASALSSPSRNPPSPVSRSPPQALQSPGIGLDPLSPSFPSSNVPSGPRSPHKEEKPTPRTGPNAPPSTVSENESVIRTKQTQTQTDDLHSVPISERQAEQQNLDSPSPPPSRSQTLKQTLGISGSSTVPASFLRSTMGQGQGKEVAEKDRLQQQKERFPVPPAPLSPVKTSPKKEPGMLNSEMRRRERGGKRRPWETKHEHALNTAHAEEREEMIKQGVWEGARRGSTLGVSKRPNTDAVGKAGSQSPKKQREREAERASPSGSESEGSVRKKEKGEKANKGQGLPSFRGPRPFEFTYPYIPVPTDYDYTEVVQRFKGLRTGNKGKRGSVTFAADVRGGTPIERDRSPRRRSQPERRSFPPRQTENAELGPQESIGIPPLPSQSLSPPLGSVVLHDEEEGFDFDEEEREMHKESIGYLTRQPLHGPLSARSLSSGGERSSRSRSRSPNGEGSLATAEEGADGNRQILNFERDEEGMLLQVKSNLALDAFMKNEVESALKRREAAQQAFVLEPPEDLKVDALEELLVEEEGLMPIRPSSNSRHSRRSQTLFHATKVSADLHEREPGDSLHLYNRGTAYLALARFGAALRDFEDAVDGCVKRGVDCPNDFLVARASAAANIPSGAEGVEGLRRNVARTWADFEIVFAQCEPEEVKRATMIRMRVKHRGAFPAFVRHHQPAEPEIETSHILSGLLSFQTPMRRKRVGQFRGCFDADVNEPNEFVNQKRFDLAHRQTVTRNLRQLKPFMFVESSDLIDAIKHMSIRIVPRDHLFLPMEQLVIILSGSLLSVRFAVPEDVDFTEDAAAIDSEFLDQQRHADYLDMERKVLEKQRPMLRGEKLLALNAKIAQAQTEIFQLRGVIAEARAKQTIHSLAKEQPRLLPVREYRLSSGLKESRVLNEGTALLDGQPLTKEMDLQKEKEEKEERQFEIHKTEGGGRGGNEVLRGARGRASIVHSKAGSASGGSVAASRRGDDAMTVSSGASRQQGSQSKGGKARRVERAGMLPEGMAPPGQRVKVTDVSGRVCGNATGSDHWLMAGSEQTELLVMPSARWLRMLERSRKGVYWTQFCKLEKMTFFQGLPSHILLVLLQDFLELRTLMHGEVIFDPWAKRGLTFAGHKEGPLPSLIFVMEGSIRLMEQIAHGHPEYGFVVPIEVPVPNSLAHLVAPPPSTDHAYQAPGWRTLCRVDECDTLVVAGFNISRTTMDSEGTARARNKGGHSSSSGSASPHKPPSPSTKRVIKKTKEQSPTAGNESPGQKQKSPGGNNTGEEGGDLSPRLQATKEELDTGGFHEKMDKDRARERRRKSKTKEDGPQAVNLKYIGRFVRTTRCEVGSVEATVLLLREEALSRLPLNFLESLVERSKQADLTLEDRISDNNIQKVRNADLIERTMPLKKQGFLFG